MNQRNFRQRRILLAKTRSDAIADLSFEYCLPILDVVSALGSASRHIAGEFVVAPLVQTGVFVRDQSRPRGLSAEIRDMSGACHVRCWLWFGIVEEMLDPQLIRLLTYYWRNASSSSTPIAVFQSVHFSKRSSLISGSGVFHWVFVTSGVGCGSGSSRRCWKRKS